MILAYVTPLEMNELLHTGSFSIPMSHLAFYLYASKGWYKLTYAPFTSKGVLKSLKAILSTIALPTTNMYMIMDYGITNTFLMVNDSHADDCLSEKPW